MVFNNCEKTTAGVANGNITMDEGYMGLQKVIVFRDSACMSAAVKKDLVTTRQMTDKVHSCKLIDSTVCHYPVAKIHMDTLYYIGEVEVICMEDPICDLLISNIPGAQGVKDPQGVKGSDSNWIPQLAQAVVTKAQTKCNKDDIKSLKVS